MGKGIAGLEAAYRGLFTAVLIVLALLVILCLLRAIIGPRTADRIVSVNMTGTMVIVIIGILTVMMGEGYLADICIIYAMISFLAVIVLTKVYMGVYTEKKEAGEKQGQAGETASRTQETAAPPGSNPEQPEEDPESTGENCLEQTKAVPETSGQKSAGKEMIGREAKVKEANAKEFKA